MPDSNGPQNNDENRSPEEEMRRMIEQMLGGGMIDSDKLAGAAGLPGDPQALAHMLMQLQQAMQHPSDGVNWDLVRDAARRAAAPNDEVAEDDARAYDRAFQVASLWLADAMGDSLGGFSGIPQTITRYEWLELTLDGWAELTNPVATSISNALVEVLAEQAPEEMKDMVSRSGPIVRSLGQSMFAMQLGQVLGQLAKEVLSGGDIGMPVLPDHKAALVPQNLQEWSAELELERDEVLIYFALRELAHAQLFAHARWLRLHLVSSIAEFARGIRIDTDRIEETIRELDVSNPEEIQLVLKSGQLIPPRTPEQDQALERLETVLALIEGWVDVVTEDATSRLPNVGALSEMVRRRLREAVSMWRLVTEKLGAAQRDALWDHRDALPGAEDIDDPFALVERLQGGGAEPDELDNDLARLLGDPDSFGDAPAGGETGDDDTK